MKILNFLIDHEACKRQLGVLNEKLLVHYEHLKTIKKTIETIWSSKFRIQKLDSSL